MGRAEILVLGAGRDGPSWASLVIAKILDSFSVLSWEADKELEDDPLR